MLGGIEVAQPPQVILGAAAARPCRQALGEIREYRGAYLIEVVGQVGVGETAGEALLAAGEAPDERPVARVVFSDAGLLFDHLRTVQSEARLAGHQHIAAQPGGDGHAAEAADRPGDHRHHRLVALQIDDGRLDLGDRRQSEVGFLQAHATGFQQQQGPGRNAVAVVLGGQLQRAGDLRSADFAKAAALEGTFDGGEHRRLAVEQATSDHYPIVGLGHDALSFQPG